MSTAAALLSLAVGLAGCEAGPRVRIAERCQSWGYEPGSELFLNCVSHQQQIGIQAIGMWQANVAAAQPNPFADMYRASMMRHPVNCLGSANGGIYSWQCN